MFSNRNIVKMLTSLPEEVRRDCMSDLLGRIEAGGTNGVAARWELLVLYALATTRQLELVPKREGRRRPDAIFHCAKTGERALIEVTAMSDEELSERYPDDEFSRLLHRALMRRTKKHIGAFHIQFTPENESEDRPVFALPKRNELYRWIEDTQIQHYLRKIVDKPLEKHATAIVRGKAVTQIAFVPGAKYSSSNSGSFLARRFNLANQDRVYRRIRDKAAQIKKAGFELPSILVLCDNDCTVLKRSSAPNWGENIYDSIAKYISGQPEWKVGDFVIRKGARQQTTSINAVLLLSVKEDRLYGTAPRRSIEGKWIMNDGQVRHQVLEQSLAEFGAAFSYTPEIRRTPINSRHPLKWPEHFGGGSMQGNSIQFSLLTIQDLLSGRMKHEDFVREHGPLAAQLIRLAAGGRCISSVRCIPMPDHDDDLIEFTFDGIDPRFLRKLAEEEQ